MIEFIQQLQPQNLYPIIFFGHIFLGGLILIPSLYMSMTGALSLYIVLALIIASSMIADSVWYTIGRNIRKERIYALAFVKRRVEEAKQFSHFYEKRGVWTVFITKFVYGTRIASHLLAGIHTISFSRFLLATAAGTTAWFFLLLALIKILDVGVTGTGAAAFRLQIIFLGILSLVLVFNWYSRKYVRRKLMNNTKRKKPPYA